MKAEGQALEDLANECSFIPKNTRIEDRFSSYEDRETTAFIKVGLPFEDCENAKRALDPAEIKKQGSPGFTAQLKKYQDVIETGEWSSDSEVADIDPGVIPPPPIRQEGWSDATHFYVTRQYVAYQKETVILAPPTAYAPGTDQNKKFTTFVTQESANVKGLEEKNPGLKTSPMAWSQVPQRPQLARPKALQAKPSSRQKSLNVPAQPRDPKQQRHGPGGKRRGRKVQIKN